MAIVPIINVTQLQTTVNALTVKNEETQAPWGFLNEENCEIAFDDITLTLSIYVVPPATEFDVYLNGVKFTFDHTISISIPDVSGSYYIVMDATTGNLELSNDLDLDYIESKMPMAFLRWNATKHSLVTFFDFRPKTVLVNPISYRKFYQIGEKYLSGFTLSDYTLIGDGSLNAHAQFGMSSGTFTFVGANITVLDTATPTQELQQKLSVPCRIPIFWRSGTSGDLDSDPVADFICKKGVSNLYHNENVLGTWGLQECSDDEYIAYYVFASYDERPSESIFIVMGQRCDVDLATAKAQNTIGSLELGNFNYFGTRPLYRMIFKTNSTYVNDIKAVLVDIEDLRTTATQTVSAPVTMTHDELLNRDNPNQHSSTAINFTKIYPQADSTNAIQFTKADGATVLMSIDTGATPLFNFHSKLQIEGVDVVDLSSVQSLSSKTISADSNTISDLVVGNLKSGVLDVDLVTVSASDDTIPSAKAVKAYADLKVLANVAIVGGTATKITYDTKGLVTSATPATTADIDSSTDRRYVTDANLIVIGNTSNTNSGDETQSTILTKTGIDASTGFVVQTSATTFIKRTLLGTTNQVIVTNPDGVAGTPTLSLPQSIDSTADVTFNTAVLTNGASGTKFKITPEGGYAVLLTNKTGVASVKGRIVSINSAIDESFILTLGDGENPVGVMYDVGVADGNLCWVVVMGIADVMLKDGSAATRGRYVGMSDTNGRAVTNTSAPTSTVTSNRHLGQCLESKNSGTGVVFKALLQLH